MPASCIVPVSSTKSIDPSGVPMNPSTCKECQRSLIPDEIGLNYKLISRECTEFLCMTCLGKAFGVTEEILQNKILQYKRQGCLLFIQDTVENDLEK